MPTSVKPRAQRHLPHDHRHLPALLDRMERPIIADLRRQYEDYLRALTEQIPVQGPEAVRQVRVPRLGPMFYGNLEAAARGGMENQAQIMRSRMERGAWHFWRRAAHLDDTPAQIVMGVADRRGLFSTDADFLKRYTASRVPPLAHVDDQLRRRAGKIVSDTLGSQGTGAVVGALRDQFPEFAEYRLANIARTETMTAFNDASLAAAWENPLATGYEWCAAMDSHTCEECQDLDEESFRMDDGGPYPPLHCECRCVPITIYLGQDEDLDWSEVPPVYNDPETRADLLGQPIKIRPGFGEQHLEGLTRGQLAPFAEEVAAALSQAGHGLDAEGVLNIARTARDIAARKAAK
jgi:SPP1 gp7 family putative phage head morphogenesis protein